MFKFRRSITANTTALSIAPKFNANDIYLLLTHIEELRNSPISFFEGKDGSCAFSVGDFIYQIGQTEKSQSNFDTVSNSLLSTV